MDDLQRSAPASRHFATCVLMPPSPGLGPPGQRLMDSVFEDSPSFLYLMLFHALIDYAFDPELV
eukprot:m.115953 g.115953  ORF g.115953 m.115953 type:complete len:64 (-) comp9489_c3_seq1:178-369(-)